MRWSEVHIFRISCCFSYTNCQNLVLVCFDSYTFRAESEVIMEGYTFLITSRKSVEQDSAMVEQSFDG